MKITVLDGFTANPGDLSWDAFAQLGDLTVYDRTSPDDVVERAKESEIIITNKTVLTRKEIERLPNLRYIGILATGYNVVDVEAARDHGIIVSNIPAYSTDSVAQQIFSLILTITNHTEYYARENREGRWTRCDDFSYTDFPLIELADKTLGIVGFGNIGRATARIARAFGMNVKAFSSKSQSELGDVEKASIEQLFSTCDVLCLCCPLTPATKGMVNAKTLSLMKKNAILINTGRGPLVNEQDLADALNNGQIFAAGLDVLSSEPPHADNPLLSACNCYITQHVAWATFEARRRLLDIAANNIKAFLIGSPANVVS